MIRILVADDHALVREGLIKIIASGDDMLVTGEACDGLETIDRVRSGDYDLLLLDMAMPGRSGVELIRQIKAEKPQLPILVLSMHKEAEYAIRTLRAGAAAAILRRRAGVDRA